MGSLRSGLANSMKRHMALPLIAAPMFRVSGPDLVVAACKSGVMGAFPTANCRTTAELDEWLARIEQSLEPDQSEQGHAAPFCANLMIRRVGLEEDLACLVRHKVPYVITSVGSPDPVIKPLQDVGSKVFADVASLRHAEKAIRAGVDGLVLLTAGSGGQTGWANSFAFVRAVRTMFEGVIVLAGGISDGCALWAAVTLGCDFGYMGTKFIATRESMASEGHKAMLVKSEFDDVMLTRAFTGLEANILRPSVVAQGLDPANLPEDMSEEKAREIWGGGAQAAGPRRWTDIWTAGHSVSGVKSIGAVDELVRQTYQEYVEAKRDTAAMLDLAPGR
jgi:nitronate monooxygenase